MNHRHVLRRILLALCVLWPIALGAQNGFTIAGIVVQNGSNRPLDRARVSINLSEARDPRQQTSVLTAGDGRFTFTGVPAGKYSLSAQWHGLNQLFRQDEQYSTAIVTGPSLDTGHIVFPLVPGGAVIVTVVDEEGEPIRGASVFLFRKGVFGGRLRCALRQQNAANSAGEYRFVNLPPDTYFVAAGGRPWYAQAAPRTEPVNEQQRTIRAELNVAYPTTYYSDSTDPQSASAISVTEGSRTEVRIALRVVPALGLEVTGLETEVNTRGFRPSFMPVLMEEGPAGIVFFNNVGAGHFNNGPYSMSGLAPGRYVLSVSRFGQPLQAGQPAPPEPSRKATLELRGDTRINIDQLPRFTISGDLRIEGPERPPALTVALQNLANRQFATGNAGSDGTFSIGAGGGPNGGLRPGQYEVRLMNNAGFYIKTIAVRGAPFTNGILDAREGADIKLSILVAKGTINLNGTALQDGKPLPGAMVLLIPQDGRRGAPVLRDQTDSDGTFTFVGAQPGLYTAVAIDNGHGLTYEEPATVKPYLENGLTVEALSRQSSPLQLNVQPRR